MTDFPVPLGVTAVMLPELDFDDQLELCRRLGVTHYSLRPRVIPDAQRSQPYSNWGHHAFDLTPQRLLTQAASIREKLSAHGMVPFGTVPAATTADRDDALTLHLDGAAAVGAGRVRVNPRPYPRTAFDYPALLDEVVRRYRDIIERLSRPRGIRLVMETHAGSLVAGPGLAYEVCRHFDPADLGVIFDLPNFAREGNAAPNLAVAALGPYIDHLHVGGSRRVTQAYDPAGFRQTRDQFCPSAESDLHLPSWLAALWRAGVRTPMILEDYTENIPGALRLENAVRQCRQAAQAAHDLLAQSAAT